MTDREQAAIRFLEQEPLWHIDMLEALNRGRGEVVYCEGQTVLVRRNEEPGSFLLTAESPAAGAAACAGASSLHQALNSSGDLPAAAVSCAIAFS